VLHFPEKITLSWGRSASKFSVILRWKPKKLCQLWGQWHSFLGFCILVDVGLISASANRAHPNFVNGVVEDCATDKTDFGTRQK